MGIDEISRFYMIGDSPFSDIEGAVRMSKLPNNENKWKAILVKTGVYKEDLHQKLTSF
jgi:ribonucleotide monophosphatase NagD (HAD superfamily)